MHSGGTSWWSIDCDALSDSEINLFAQMILREVGKVHLVTHPASHWGSCVPKLARAISEQQISSPVYPEPDLASVVFDGRKLRILIVDDVLTTGRSMEELKEGYSRSHQGNWEVEFIGAVLFARGPCPSWVKPIFQQVLGSL